MLFFWSMKWSPSLHKLDKIFRKHLQRESLFYCQNVLFPGPFPILQRSGFIGWLLLEPCSLKNCVYLIRDRRLDKIYRAKIMFQILSFHGQSSLSLMREPLQKSLISWGKELCGPTWLCPAGCRCHGRLQTSGWKSSAKERFEENSCSQSSNQASLHERNISLTLVEWHLEPEALLFNIFLFKDVIYQKQGFLDDLSLFWLLVL